MRPTRNSAVLLLGVLSLSGMESPAAAQRADSSGESYRQADDQDLRNDPLPDGAILRLGTMWLRQGQGVVGVVFSPDGSQLVSTGWEDSIRFWDAKTGRQLRRRETPTRKGTFAAAFSPKGDLLATVGESGLIRIWDLKTGDIRFDVVGHKTQGFGVRVYGVAFSPDGLTLATAGADTSVRLWDVATGTELLVLQDEGGGDAHAVVFSPDGNLLGTGSGRRSGTIRIWNLGPTPA